MRFYRDPLFRRFLSGTLFAGLFVFVAVQYFDVDTEVVWVLLVMSFVFVFGMIIVGFVLSFLLRWFRRSRDGSLLGRLSEEEKNVEGEKD